MAPAPSGSSSGGSSTITPTATVGGVDGLLDWLPPGPIPEKPEYEVTLMNVPDSVRTLSNYIKSVGWTLDGAANNSQGNEKAIERWWAEIANEQGVEWLNTQDQFGISGWALYGEIVMNAGYPLQMGDYIVAGVQTHIEDEGTRVARVEGVYEPDGNGGKRIGYYTTTYENMQTEMGFSQEPIPEDDFYSHAIGCEANFGPNPCNGLNGVFGSKFKSATYANDGLWTLWLWLPEESHVEYFDYNLQRDDEVAVWIGTYVSAGDFVTVFDSGYWSYGEILVLEKASLLSVGGWLSLLLLA